MIRARGFTLIELAVTLALLGALLALTAPALARLHARLTLAGELRDLQQRIGALPALAWSRGEEGTLAQLLERHVALPRDWSLHGAESVFIRSNGLCSGGTLELLTPGGARRIELQPPFCAAEVPM